MSEREPSQKIRRFAADDEDGDGEVAVPQPKPAISIGVSKQFAVVLISALLGLGGGVGGSALRSQGAPGAGDHQALVEEVRLLKEWKHTTEVALARRDQSIDDHLSSIDKSMGAFATALNEITNELRRRR